MGYPNDNPLFWLYGIPAPEGEIGPQARPQPVVAPQA